MHKVSRVFELYLKQHTLDNKMRQEPLYVIINRRIENSGNNVCYFAGIVNGNIKVTDKEGALKDAYSRMEGYYTAIIPAIGLGGQPSTDWDLVPLI